MHFLVRDGERIGFDAGKVDGADVEAQGLRLGRFELGVSVAVGSGSNMVKARRTMTDDFDSAERD